MRKRRGRPRQTFYDQTPQALSRDPNVSSGAKALYALLHGYCPQKRLQNNPECVVTKETLAKAMGKSVRRIDIYVNGLEKKGWIRHERHGRNNPNRYTLFASPQKKLAAVKKSFRPEIIREYDPFCQERYRREMVAEYGEDGSKISEKELLAFLGPPPALADIPFGEDFPGALEAALIFPLQ